VTLASLQAVLDHFRDSGWSPDLVQVTGDIVQDDSREAYLRFRNTMKTLGLPVYCIPGNHDIPSLMRNVLTGEPFHYCASLETGNWLIIGIDSCLENNAAGFVEESELDRLDGVIARCRSDHVMVCLHHPPLPVGSRWLDEVGLRNAGEFLQRVTGTGKTRLLVFGHVHQAFDGRHGAVRVIGTPSTCRQFAVGSNDYAVDDSPPAYRRIELHADGRVDTELVWI
jgi:Icc protein